MQCSTCRREMVQLFLSQACDYCDYGPAKAKLHRGFVVYQEKDSHHDEYVFRTHADAVKWRSAAGRDTCAVRMVYSLRPFHWHMSRGTLRDVVLADHLFEIFPDHRFEPLPHRAFLSDDDISETQEQLSPSSSVGDDDDLMPF